MDGETRTALVLRIFVRESDRVGQRTLWEEILERARRANLAGDDGPARDRGIRGAQPGAYEEDPAAVADLPMVIEIVDEEAAILAFRETVESLVRGGLITVERVESGRTEGPPRARPRRG